MNTHWSGNNPTDTSLCARSGCGREKPDGERWCSPPCHDYFLAHCLRIDATTENGLNELRRKGITPSGYETAPGGPFARQAGQLKEYAAAYGGEVLTPWHSAYPDTDKLPPILYTAGGVSRLTGRTMAIVGGRDRDFRPPQQHIDATRALAREAANNGHIVVSSMNPGLDSEAVLAALHAGGEVVVVHPAGVDIPFRANAELHADLLQHESATILSSEPYQSAYSESGVNVNYWMIGCIAQSAFLTYGTQGQGPADVVLSCGRDGKRTGAFEGSSGAVRVREVGGELIKPWDAPEYP